MLLLLSLIFFILTLGFLFFFLLLVFLCFLSFPSPFFPSLVLFFVLVYCVHLWPFYTTYRDKIYHFYPLTTFGPLWVSFQDYTLVCWLPSHYHYIVLAVPRLIPRQKWFCFVLFFTSLDTPIQIRVGLLPHQPL